MNITQIMNIVREHDDDTNACDELEDLLYEMSIDNGSVDTDEIVETVDEYCCGAAGRAVAHAFERLYENREAFLALDEVYDSADLVDMFTE